MTGISIRPCSYAWWFISKCILAVPRATIPGHGFSLLDWLDGATSWRSLIITLTSVSVNLGSAGGGWHVDLRICANLKVKGQNWWNCLSLRTYPYIHNRCEIEQGSRKTKNNWFLSIPRIPHAHSICRDFHSNASSTPNWTDDCVPEEILVAHVSVYVYSHAWHKQCNIWYVSAIFWGLKTTCL